MDIDDRRRLQPLRLAPGQAGQGVGRLAGLAHGDRHRARRHGGRAIAELRRDLDVAGQARQPFEGVAADLTGVEGGAAGHDLDAVDGGEVHALRLGPARHQVQIFRQGVLDAVGLFVDLLFHEMAVLALFDQGRGGRDLDHRPFHRLARHVEHPGAPAGHGDIVSLFQIGDLLGERAHRQGVGSQIHFVLAPADDQRAASTRAQNQVVLAVDQDSQRVGAGKPIQRDLERIQRRPARLQFSVQQVGDHLGVGLAFEDVPLGGQLGLQLGEVLDDAVVHQRHAPGLVRVGVGGGRGAVGGPAGMADADRGLHRVLGQDGLQIADLALAAAAFDMAVDHGGDPGGIIAAVFQPLQAVDQTGNDGAVSRDADDAAHAKAPLGE